MDWLAITLLTLGGALLFEGLGWAIAPDAMRNAYARMVETMDLKTLSSAGLISVAVGLLLIVIGIRALA